MYDLTPSPVRFPLSSYVNAVPPNVAIWFASSYVAEASAAGKFVRAHVPPTVARCPLAGCEGGNAEVLVEKLDRPQFVAVDATTLWFASIQSPSDVGTVQIWRVGK